jgi:preprotein translocase subunit SecE
MATETEKEKDLIEEDASRAPEKDEIARKADASVNDEPDAPNEDEKADEPADDDHVAAPMQLGTRRFVYAAYFGGAIGVAFLVAKFGNLIWARVEAYKPQIGDPHDEYIMPVAAIIGALVALYYWRRQQTRQYAEEVASELSQVTWPSRAEVTNSTTVVIIATAFATIFFALMDRFWAFVTDLVYRF